MNFRYASSRPGALNLLCGAGSLCESWCACRPHGIENAELEVNVFTIEGMIARTG
jgi:hypothetical protein